MMGVASGKKKRKAGKRAGVPVGRAAISEARLEHKKEIGKLALLIEKTTSAPSLGFLGKVRSLANRGAKSIPPALIAEGMRRGGDAWELYRAFENHDRKKLLSLFDRLALSDDVACEKAWGLMPGDAEQWQNAHPGRTARPGEVWRWTADRQDVADTARNEAALRLSAAEIASSDRDMAPPREDDFQAVFEMLRRKDWRERNFWPSVAQVKGFFSMPRKRVLIVAKSGRWGARDVWRGAACRGKKGGRPPVRLSPRALGKVLRVFAKAHPHLSAEAERLARYLSGI